jgi:HK97 family phage portal protein
MNLKNLDPRTWFRRKGFSTSDILRYVWGGDFSSGMKPRYFPLANEGYQQNPDVYACIREIATAARGIPLKAMSMTSTGEIEPLQDTHPLQILLRQPNPRMSGGAFIEWLTSYHLVAGNAFILKASAETLAVPRELYLLRPDTVTPIRGETLGTVARYEYRPAGGTGGVVVYEPDDICDFPFFNPLDDLCGQPPMQAAVRGVDIGNRGRTWNYNLLQNASRPPGLLTTDQGLSPDQRERLAQTIAANFGGQDNAGKVPVLEAGLEWKPTGLTPGEMDWTGMLTMSKRDVCQVFGVPPELIGDASQKTYSNYREARQAFYTETVLPLMDWICDELTGWLSPVYGAGIVIGYDKAGIEALAEDENAKWARLVNAWWLTPNQRLAECGFEQSTDPLMDVIYIPAGLMPLSTAGGVIEDYDGTPE